MQHLDEHILHVFVRESAIDARASIDGSAALLLEGDWPAALHGPGHWSLDSSIDVRHGWIDRTAIELAEQAARVESERFRSQSDDGLPAAYIFALSLRYYLVRLLRVVAWWRMAGAQLGVTRVRLFGITSADQDYRLLFEQLCHESGIHLDVEAAPLAAPSRASEGRSSAFDWRQAAKRLLAWGLNRSRPHSEGRGPTIVFCGDRHRLGGVCDELLATHHSVHWLYDCFSPGTYARWQGRVRQLIVGRCETRRAAFDGATEHNIAQAADCEPLCFDGIDLGPAVAGWLGQRVQTEQRVSGGVVESLSRQWARLRPSAIVFDEDATPLARVAIATARKYGAHSIVVQHGAPCVRFGFSPLAADRICVWGEAARAQLQAWNVPRDRIVVTGCPWLTNPPSCSKSPPLASCRHQRAPRILLLTTVPPRDARPDAAEFHLTTATYRTMLEMIVAATMSLGPIRLTIKPHPRARHDAILASALDHLPVATRHNICIDRRNSLSRLLARHDAAIGCASSTVVEAAWQGVPTIQCLPNGSGDLLPCELWGGIGTARTAGELESLLCQALAMRDRRTTQSPATAFVASPGEARKRIAAVLTDLMQCSPAAACGKRSKGVVPAFSGSERLAHLVE